MDAEAIVFYDLSFRVSDEHWHRELGESEKDEVDVDVNEEHKDHEEENNVTSSELVVGNEVELSLDDTQVPISRCTS